MKKQLIHFQFEPRQVSSLQMQALLDAFDLNAIAVPALRGFCGAVEIRFNHAAGDPHPVLDMKLRQFLRALAHRWGPHSAPFFCELESPFMLLYFTAQLNNMLVAEYADGDDFVVRHRAPELQALRKLAREGILIMGRRAGMTTGEIRQRQNKVSMLFETVFHYPFHF